MHGERELSEFCMAHSTLFLYGAGRFGELTEKFLKRKGIAIAGFCVTNIDERETFHGYPVREIAEIRKNWEEAGIVVTVNEKYAGDVLEKVKGLHFFYDKSLLREIVYEDVIRNAEERVKSVIVRNNVLCMAGGVAFEAKSTYIVCPGPIGDTLYVAALVRAYKQKYATSSVILIVRKNHASIGALFPSVDGCIVSDELVEILDAYSRSRVVWELENYRYGFGREDYFRHNYMAPYVPRNLLSGYKIAIMGLEEEAECEEMYIDRSVQLPEGFDQKTVIVMPHESSARRLPFSFWEELCGELSREYVVYTNTKDETELPVKGTRAVSEPLKDMANICEHCFAVISIRTGICDLLAFTKSNLIVLNTERQLAEKWDLRKAFDRENLVNIDCYEAFDREVLKENILRQLKEFS